MSTTAASGRAATTAVSSPLSSSSSTSSSSSAASPAAEEASSVPTGHKQEPSSFASWANRQTLSSQFAGGVSTLCFYPLDVVKMRMMAQDGTATRMHSASGSEYRGIASALRSIVAEDGALGLFRGSHVAVGAATVAWGLYMYAYRQADARLRNLVGGNSDRPDRLGGIFGGSLQTSAVAGISAGAIVNVITNPFWLIKSRMQLHRPGEPMLGFFGTMRAAVARDGVRSLWRGTSAQIAAGLPNSLQFPVYESWRRTYRAACTSYAKRNGGEIDEHASSSTPGYAEVTVCTIGTKLVLGAVAHPTQVLKARLMDWRSRSGEVQYTSLPTAVATIARREGVAGFYRGVLVGFAHTIPRTILQFQIYEAAVSWFAIGGGGSATSTPTGSSSTSPSRR